MLLAIDMGNTQTALGLFDENELVRSWRMPTDRSFTAPVTLWGNLGGPWRPLLTEDREFPAHSHPHLYFTIPAQRLSSAFWEGQEVEELALAAGETVPSPGENGVLVFFE